MLITSILLSLVPNAAQPVAVLEVRPSVEIDLGTAASSPTFDGPQAAQLPAETRFVAHIDVRAILASRLWNDYLGGNLGDLGEEAMEGINELKEQLGIDPFKDIYSVTVFGSSPDEDSAAVLVRGSSALEGALRRVEEMEECTRFEVEGLNLHVFDQGSETTYLYSHGSDRSGETTIVLSPSRTELLRAALVLRGGRKSLAAARAEGAAPVGLDLNAPVGTFLHVAFAGSIPGLDGQDPVSGILKMARGGVFSVGESRGDLTLHLGIVTESEDQAMDMADGIDGLKSVANMLLRSMDEVPDDARKLLRSFRVNNEDSTVFIDFNYSIESLFQIIDENGLDFDR